MGGTVPGPDVGLERFHEGGEAAVHAVVQPETGNGWLAVEEPVQERAGGNGRTSLGDDGGVHRPEPGEGGDRGGSEGLPVERLPRGDGGKTGSPRSIRTSDGDGRRGWTRRRVRGVSGVAVPERGATGSG